MARFIAQLVIAGTQIVAKAFARAVQQEIAASQEAARRLGNRRGREHSIANAKTGISLDEAKQILNVNEMSKEEIQQRYDFLFKANQRENGGTFYIQSKIVRAKERLDMELTEPQPETNRGSAKEKT